MRIPINLASQPLENLRLLRAAVALTAATALLFGVVIVRNELRNRSEFQALIEQRDTLQASLASLRSEQQDLESWLSTPQAEQIRERSAFLNSLILRKSLSWTQMFVDLEKILPPRVRITSIKPSLGVSHEADLALTAAADSMTPLVEFLKNLEGSPKFGPPAVGAQKYATQGAEEGGIAIDLTTRYLQQHAAAPAAAAAAEQEQEEAVDEMAEDEEPAEETAGESEMEAAR